MTCRPGNLVKAKVAGTYMCFTACAHWFVGREEPSFIAEASFVKAPLNSRVASGASVPNGKGKAKQESLDRLPLEIQESLILEDLLFVLMVSVMIVTPANNCRRLLL